MGSPFKVKAAAGGGGEVPPAGTHPAVLVALIDLGTQENDYQGNRKWGREVYLVWELPTEKQSGKKDRNHVVGRDYTLTFGPKSLLRGLIEKWRGKGFAEDEEFDLTKLLGKACLLTLVHKQSSGGSTYAKIDGVSGVPKGMTVPEPQNKPFLWSLDDGDAPPQDWIPYLYGEPLKDVLNRCRERNGGAPPEDAGRRGPEPAGAAAGGGSDEIPF